MPHQDHSPHGKKLHEQLGPQPTAASALAGRWAGGGGGGCERLGLGKRREAERSLGGQRCPEPLFDVRSPDPGPATTCIVFPVPGSVPGSALPTPAGGLPGFSFKRLRGSLSPVTQVLLLWPFAYEETEVRGPALVLVPSPPTRAPSPCLSAGDRSHRASLRQPSCMLHECPDCPPQCHLRPDNTRHSASPATGPSQTGRSPPCLPSLLASGIVWPVPQGPGP